MNDEYKKLDLTEFVNQYILDQNIEARKYCFILGAGASKQSGVPTGAELARKWVKEIETKYTKTNVDEWKEKIGLVEGREAEKYSEIYGKRFEINPKEGYLFLESIMEKIEPSFGYSVLAKILEETDDKIVITTNFDSLIEDAMFIYTTKRPLTLGHESLAGYVNVLSKRPIIAKIHRDLLLSPKNRQNEIETLEKAWEENLAAIFKYYTPVIIGYGGNDGSLMKFLENKANSTTGMFWFYWEGNKEGEDYIPNERILNLVHDYDGYIIPIKGFDEMMLQINEALGYKLIEDELVEIAEQRTKTYHDKLIESASDKNTSPRVKEMILSAVGKQEKDWWTIQIEIDNEDNIKKKNEMYLKGIKELKNSPELIGNYASFLYKVKGDSEKAEEYYEKAMVLEANNTVTLSNYATFLWNVKNDHDKAEKLYLKAISLNPSGDNIIGNYANFLADIRNNYNKAEIYFLEAIKLNPKKPYHIGNYAKLKIKQEDYNEAKKLINIAFELNKEENDLLLELWFYRYAIYKEWYEEAEAKLEELLNKGIKSIEWDFDGVIEKAKKLGHKNFEKLIEFKDRITKR